MKTLNEVIKAFECCENGEPYSNCEECSYIGIGSCCLERENDALHYLKEYRDKAHKLDIDIAEHRRTFKQLGVEIARYKKAKAEMEDISADYVALNQWWAEQQENPPLTLQELKAMRGKPVWIEYMEKDYENEWVLVVKNPERPIFGTPTLLAFARDGERIYLTISGYGKRWQAYRNMK